MGNDQPQREREEGRSLPRIAAIAAVVLFVEWSVADPARIAAHPELSPLPFALLAIMFPIGLVVWAMHASTGERYGAKLDFLWGVLVGTVGYVVASLAIRL